MFKMSQSRHLNFRTFLTERFTAVAVEVFEEVESIVEEYYEENKRLRDILHMVLNPQINVHKIDLSQHTGAFTDVREQLPEPNTRVDVEISEPLLKKPKEEQIEYDISCRSEEQQGHEQADNFITPDCLKEDPDEEHSVMSHIIDTYNIVIVEPNPDSSATASADEAIGEHEDCSSLDSYGVKDCPQLSRSEEGPSESREPHKHNKEAEQKCFKQKTLLELPRMMPYKAFTAAPPDCLSFSSRLTEAYKDIPEDEKPLITKMGLTADVELVNSAFGKVPKGCPLSYQCPFPSIQDYTTIDDAPPRPKLPLFPLTMEPVSDPPNLSPQEKEHMAVMQITWEEAHNLEQSTRKQKELVTELRRLRLTDRFKDICKLKPGKSLAAHLVFKILKGPPKAGRLEKEMKIEALRIYCQNLCFNWYPCGFIVHPNAPWLGAHPDGLVYDPKEKFSFGLVHVKCTQFQSFIDCSFLTRQDGVLKVKKTHSYYWHIQGEMMVAGVSWCDLLVFSREDVLVQRIYRDNAMIKVMRSKLDDFFFRFYLPSLVENDNAS